MPADVARILVIRLGAMGDVVRTLPAVAELRSRRPEAQIHWLLESRVRGVVEGRPYVDGIVEFPRDRIEAALRAGAIPVAIRIFRDFRHELRDGNWDVVLDFHSIARSAVLARASGAPMRVTFDAPYAREGAQRVATHRARLAPARLSRFDRNQALVDFAAPVGGEPIVTRPVSAPLDVAPQRIAALLGARSVSAPILLHPGASASAAYKRWPIAGFAELAARLAADGERVLVAYGAGERADAQAVVDASGGAAALAPHTKDFETLAALLAGGRAFVGADSGPLHVASLVGTPVVQLLGPTHPVENAPWSRSPSRTVRGGDALPCSPCRRGCAAAACMREIAGAAVYDALRELVAAPGPSANTHPQSTPRGHSSFPTLS
jgi:heptosyltransferase-1